MTVGSLLAPKASTRRRIANVVREIVESSSKVEALDRMFATAKAYWDERWFGDAHDMGLFALAFSREPKALGAPGKTLLIARWLAERFPAVVNLKVLGDEYQRAGDERAAARSWHRSRAHAQVERNRRAIALTAGQLGRSMPRLDDIDVAINDMPYGSMPFAKAMHDLDELSRKARRQRRWQDFEILTRVALRRSLGHSSRKHTQTFVRRLSTIADDTSGLLMVAEAYDFLQKPVLARRFLRQAENAAWRAGSSNGIANADAMRNAWGKQSRTKAKTTSHAQRRPRDPLGQPRARRAR